jgi:hypothetical protein
VLHPTVFGQISNHRRRRTMMDQKATSWAFADGWGYIDNGGVAVCPRRPIPFGATVRWADPQADNPLLW